MRHTLLLAILFAGTVHAAPASLKQAAVDQLKDEAANKLGAAKTKASTLRARAGDRASVLEDQRKATRSDIAKKLWGARGERRAMKLSLVETLAQRQAADATLEATKTELTSAKQTMNESHGTLSWLASNAKFAVTRGGRARLAKYETDKTAHETLHRRSTEEQGTLDRLVEKVGEFEQGVDRLNKEITAQRGRKRNISSEVEGATDREIKQLEASAVAVEDQARESIHTLVKGFVAKETAPQRDPITRARDTASRAMQSGNQADSTIQAAHREIEEAKQIERNNALGDGLEMAFGGKNQTADALFKLGRAIGDVSSTWSEQDAQRVIRRANSEVESFQREVDALKRETTALEHGAGGIDTRAAQVRANVTAVAYVDLLVNLTRFDSAFTDFVAGATEQIQLSRADHQLMDMRGSVNAMRSQVSSIHAQLDRRLQELDTRSAQIVGEAVAELTQK